MTTLGDFTPSGDVRRFTPEEFERFSRLPFAEQKRQEADLERRWREQMQTAPFNKRERDAFHILASYPADTLIPFKDIRITYTAAERLKARGFLEIRMKGADRIEGYVLTKAGLTKAQQLRDT